MIISHKYKFIFARPMKTAGLSFETAVSNYCSAGDIVTRANRDEDWIRKALKAKRHRNDYTPDSKVRIRPHFPLKRIFDKGDNKGYIQEFTPELQAAMKSYRIISMTRNPWDKIRSLYYHQLRDFKQSEGDKPFKVWCAIPAQESDRLLAKYVARDTRVTSKYEDKVDFWIRFTHLEEDITEFENYYGMKGLYDMFDSYAFHVYGTNKRHVPLREWYENRNAMEIAEYIEEKYQWHINKFNYSYE